MANLVSLLSYSNTFGDLVLTMNQLAQEIDNLGKYNYTKDTGLLTLNSPGTGLQVSNNSLFTGNVVISGSGQALQVSRDAIISGNLTVSGNTTINLNEVAIGNISSNTTYANSASFLTLNATNALSVTGNTTLTILSANSLSGQANTQIAQQISDAANAVSSLSLALSIALG
jgi:hypothetical protein